MKFEGKYVGFGCKRKQHLYGKAKHMTQVVL